MAGREGTVHNVHRKKIGYPPPQPSSPRPSESIKEEIRDSQDPIARQQGLEEGTVDVAVPGCQEKGCLIGEELLAGD